MTENLDRLKAAYQSWHDTKGADRSVWADLMAERITIRHVDEHSHGLEFAKDSASRDEALQYLTRIFDDWEMVHYSPHTYLAEGDRIAMFGKSAFRYKKTGKVAEMAMAVLWRFENGEAVSLHEVYDTAVAMTAATA